MDSHELLYSLAAFMVVLSGVFCSTVKWFHMCEPYDKDEGFYYPSRRVYAVSQLMLLLLLPYVFAPMDEDIWLATKCFTVMCVPLLIDWMILRYFFNSKEYKRRRRVFLFESILPLSLSVVIVIVAVIPGISLQGVSNSIFIITCILSVMMLLENLWGAWWLWKRIYGYHHDHFSSDSDFPFKSINAVIVQPQVFIVLAWTMFITNSRDYHMILNIIWTAWSIHILITMLKPHKQVSVTEITLSMIEEEVVEGELKSTSPTDGSREKKYEEIKKKIERFIIEEEGFKDLYLTLQGVADKVGCGRTYVSIVFKQELGGYYTYINRKRLEFARKYEQEHPRATKDEIAFESGFNSRQALANAAKYLE